MAEKATLLVTATPNGDEPEAMRSYLTDVGPLLMAAGGNPPRRLKVTNTVSGEPFGICMVMDFPSAEAIETVFESDAYKALIPGRDKGFRGINILIAADM